MEENKENTEKIFNVLDLNELDLEIICKDWNTQDDKDSDFSKDFVYQSLFKSRSKKLMLWVSLENNNLFVQFLYDVSDKELEKNIIASHHKLRTHFGEDKAPFFNVLSKSRTGFYTKEIKTEKYNLDISKLYNTDFQPLDKTIKNSLAEDKAGLILLHGTSGTGKTSYIKSLIGEFEDKTFIFIQNEFVQELLHPDFVTFLLQHKNSILIIEDAEKVIMTRENSNENSVVSTILQLTDGLFSDYLNIKIICTFNTNINKIDKALLRKGRMIAYYDFKPLEIEKTNAFLESMGHQKVDEPMTLADIFNYQSTHFEESSSVKKIGFQ